MRKGFGGLFFSGIRLYLRFPQAVEVAVFPGGEDGFGDSKVGFGLVWATGSLFSLIVTFITDCRPFFEHFPVMFFNELLDLADVL